MPTTGLLKQHLLVFCLAVLAPLGMAQEVTRENESLLRDSLAAAETVLETRELKVLSNTLAAEQIDRAVLNRLMQEIIESPADSATRLGVDATTLQDVLIIIANAHGFINDNDPANVQAMCKTWVESTQSGSARVEEALAAYERRAQFTRDFIAGYYAVVLSQIEAVLSETALPAFNAYMTDRRRRMATTGAVASSAVSQNVRSGEESIRFHCRTD